MEISKLSRRIFKLIGVCSFPDGSASFLKCGQICCAVYVVFALLLIEWESGLSLIEHIEMGDVGKHAFVLIEVISPVKRMKCVCEYFDRIQNIFDVNTDQTFTIYHGMIRFVFQTKTLRRP